MTIKTEIGQAVREVLIKPSIPVASGDVPQVTAAVTREIAPIVEHATNNEPWYQSRVTIGAVLTLISGIYALATDFADGTPPDVETFTASAGVIAGAILTLYGRWVARKPLGA